MHQSSELWLDPKSYSPHWTPRAVKAVAMLENAFAVCDIGCGAPQDVRSILPDDIRYLPADLKQWTSDTEICDLNAGIFPEKSLSACDYVLMLGVIEYIFDPAKVFSGLSLRSLRMVTSYHPSELRLDRWPTWVNNFGEDEYLSMAQQSGWVLKERLPLDHGQVLYAFLRASV